MQITRCLIVEDHPDAQGWLSEALTQAFGQIDIQIAADVRQGRELARQPFDLALLDISLPDGTGLELVPSLVDAGCEVVISSVLADDTHVVQALKDGAKGYILKDHSKQELVDMLQGIMAGQPPLSPSIARRVLEHFRNLTTSTTQPIDTADDLPKQTSQRNGATDSEQDVTLTTRERDVLTLLAKGYTVKAVADMLEISPNTTAGYAKTIYRKLNVSSRAEATMEANRLGYVR